MSAASRGFLIMALAFPIYLLWQGRLPAYLALMTSGAINPTSGTTQTPTAIGGGTVTNPTVTTGQGTFVIPPIQTQASPGSM